MNEQTIDLSVDITTFNMIMQGLDELPHKLSRRTIDELVRQAQPQVNQQGLSSSTGGQEQPAGPLGSKVIN